MPIYTYRCEGCGETFDKRQSVSDASLTTHETCGGGLRKVLHPVGIVFKGSGFYNTDYKNGSASAKADGDTPSEGAAASTDASSESKSESKGETKSESKGETKSDATPTTGASTTSDSGSSGTSTGTTKSEPAKSTSTS